MQEIDTSNVHLAGESLDLCCQLASSQVQIVGGLRQTNVCALQVVVNPFIWDRLQKPGQHIPFMFETFKPAKKLKREAAALLDNFPEDAFKQLPPALQQLQSLANCL